jgi:hypothetical protein
MFVVTYNVICCIECSNLICSVSKQIFNHCNPSCHILISSFLSIYSQKGVHTPKLLGGPNPSSNHLCLPHWHHWCALQYKRWNLEEFCALRQNHWTTELIIKSWKSYSCQIPIYILGIPSSCIGGEVDHQKVHDNAELYVPMLQAHYQIMSTTSSKCCNNTHHS